MLNHKPLETPKGIRAVINDAYHVDEKAHVEMLLKNASLSKTQNEQIKQFATKLVELVRAKRKRSTGIDSFLSEYSLSSEEGIALMCLAEALLRVPDSFTIDELIKDKLSNADWKSHRGQSDSFFVNATTWALMLTGRVLTPEKAENALQKALMKLVNRSSEGLIRKAVEKAMQIMSKQFVMGRNMDDALKRAKPKEALGYLYSYDMLGEAALTAEKATSYFESYAQAIEKIGKKGPYDSIHKSPGISVKLSALYPRYEEAQREKALMALTQQLLALAKMAKQYNISLTVDAEESERLDLSLDVFLNVYANKALDGWVGLGLAVQSYQKRAFYVIDWVADIARTYKRRINVRLIKGAYWDSEIKKTQMQGFADYPVFTRKCFTDVSFQACAKKILKFTDYIYPQFATHNIYSVAMILNLVGDYRDFEFQCLHGMGNELYDYVVSESEFKIPCRIYAPVGVYEDLLPYLVRRLLENGANTSFVNRLEDAPMAELVEDPVEKSISLINRINQNIPLPKSIFLPVRKNSSGLDLTDRYVLASLQETYRKMDLCNWHATPIIADMKTFKRQRQTVYAPQNQRQAIGSVIWTSPDEVEQALKKAEFQFTKWHQMSVHERAKRVEAFAQLLEKNSPELLAILCFEAGKTWNDGVAEIREAVDFCYYYAANAIRMMENPVSLHGYTGERDELSLHPRGTILCISPWNFPLAIFTGQIIAAIVTGNVVIAKPAEQTSLIAHFTVQLMLQAGIPEGVVQCLPGDGENVGAQLVADERIKGVVFTGSVPTAKLINKTLSQRHGEIIPLIAETGGLNAMIVDSSALLEQVTKDVLISAFGSAGQRCSALRVLYVQEEIFNPFQEMLCGAMAELNINDPQWLDTDIGPVIDKDALTMLQQHIEKMKKTHKIIYQCKQGHACEKGFFIPPIAIEISHINDLEEEKFGPVLHVIRFKRKQLDDVIQQVNGTGYGLTFGIHSRINSTAEYIRQRIKVGNC